MNAMPITSLAIRFGRSWCLCVAFVGVLAGIAGTVPAATITKDNNADDLNLTTSWVGGVVPTAADIGLWDSTVTAANTTALGADLTLAGVSVTNPGGLVTISAGNTLSLGGSGINMGSAAGQNLTLNANVTLTAGQNWSLGSGRTITVNGDLDLGANRLLFNMAGTTGLTGVISGTATSDALFVSNGSSGGRVVLDNPNNTFTGSIELSNSGSQILEFTSAGALGNTSELQFRNTGGTAGSGSFVRYTGTTDEVVSQTLQCDTSIGIRLESNSAGGSVTFNGSFNQSNRPLYLGGTGTGSNTLATAFTGNGAITKRNGGTWVLAAANTNSGGVTVEGGTLVIGGGAATGSISGNATVTGGTLAFNRSDSSSYGGVISGAGGVRQDGPGTLTLTGANTYTGQTRVSAGTLAYTTDNALGSNLVNSGGETGAVVDFGANRITIGNSGSNSTGFYYGTLSGTGTVALQGGSATIVNADGSGGASTNFQIFDVDLPLSPTAFALDTGPSATDRKDFAYLNDVGDPLTLSSLSGYGAIRNDAGGASTRAYIVDQSVDTTFDGAIVSHRSSAGVQRLVSLEKQGSGSLTLAGFIGKQTVSAQAGAAPVTLTANGGVLSVTNAENTTTANTDAINLGTVTVTSGVLAFSDQALVNTTGTAGASSILMNGGTLRWNTGTTQDLTVGGRLSFVPGATATFDTNGNDVSLGSFLGGDGTGSALVKAGTGTLTLGAASDLSGATTVSAGTLLVNASLSATSGLTVNSGAVFGGSGSVNAVISGAGLVSPGNSPGITRADAIDPSAGTSFAFEFTATGSPTYSDATASVNDVLRLDDATTPFVANLSGSNVVDVYFDVTTLAGGDTFKGGFFTDLASDFTSAVENGTYAYWVKGDGTGTDRTFNGQGYFSLANFDAGLSVNLATVAETADFVGGTVNGQVTEFSVVPEPTAIALVAAAAGLFAAVRHRRR
ncbi:MAG: autotransporter-associated beta strand repeat-containing protein [Planctomycetota bacterium]|nr:autotransporter-associated beta strand repeat-containing protein [Planctomycetota bacterium]